MVLIMMTPIQKQNKKLVRKYPFLKIAKDYSYTWLDMLPRGWKNSFGLDMCKDLKAILRKACYVRKFRIYDLKEKYGWLRIEYNSIPKKISDDIDRWENYYEDLSMLTCLNCGQPTEYVTRGWISYVCSSCVDSHAADKLTVNDIPHRVHVSTEGTREIPSELIEQFKMFWDDPEQKEGVKK